MCPATVWRHRRRKAQNQLILNISLFSKTEMKSHESVATKCQVQSKLIIKDPIFWDQIGTLVPNLGPFWSACKCGATCVPGKVAIGGDQSLVQLELCSSFTLPVIKSFKHPHSTSKCHSVQVHHQDNVHNDSWQTLVFLCELS